MFPGPDAMGSSPAPRDLVPKNGEKHITSAYNVLYIPWMVIFGGHNIRKKSFENFDF